MMSLERVEPIKSADDSFLVQLLRNGETVYSWHEKLRQDEKDKKLPTTGTGRTGLSQECYSDFQVRHPSFWTGLLSRWPHSTCIGGLK